MKAKELVEQLQKLDENMEVYIPQELELKEPVIQVMEFKDDAYSLIVC